MISCNIPEMITFQSDDLSDDEISLWPTKDGTSISITLENPWSGDTETGLGSYCNGDLSLNDARALYEWLGKFFEDQYGTYAE